jgi:hypothetical protein
MITTNWLLPFLLSTFVIAILGPGLRTKGIKIRGYDGEGTNNSHSRHLSKRHSMTSELLRITFFDLLKMPAFIPDD